jgi:hypothetical protein
VVEIANGEKDFVENARVGQIFAIRDTVHLSITGPCPRCVMTALPKAISRRMGVSCARQPNTIGLTSGCKPLFCKVARSAVVIP